MTIKEYLEKLERLPHRSADGSSLADTMSASTNIWSNDACMGYCITAMQTAGCDRGQIRNVLKELRELMDEMTQEQAEHAYFDF